MTLDGNQITAEELAVKLEEASTNNSVRIVEKADGEWITLKKLNG